ncbi:phage virion morphogenesis protein [Entomomonas asaccharolytica]|uniref:Uncharacterized protein n=1 Tax=Entomomonas asaccharolytica TaxID=2785331 RepID=A0A974NHH5_9GAMM|nr:hypothetical protein [Entomomonas asaccharolytica]QQP86940.1 hypothetical protein JHT90_06760 [Entomomonas asaccharolytica]
MATKIEKNIDLSKWQTLEDELLKLANKHVVVGVPASNNSRSDGVTNALIAAVHELGVPELNIAERSFLRASLTGNQGKYIRLNAENFKRVLNHQMSIDQALNVLGLIAAGDVKAFIANGDFTPLKPETIKRKGSSKPLIDTGELRQSITYEVRNND